MYPDGVVRRDRVDPVAGWQFASPVLMVPGVLASRSCTDARPDPPSTKCTCVSIKPGVSICPLALICTVSGPTSRAISSLSPTALIRSPVTATASAQGCAGSPVQTRASVTTSVAGCDVAVLPVSRPGWQALSHARMNKPATSSGCFSLYSNPFMLLLRIWQSLMIQNKIRGHRRYEGLSTR